MTPARLFVPVLIALLGAPCLGQDLIAKVNGRLNGQPDPVDLLRKSAAAFEAAPQSTFSIVNSIDIVAGEREDTQQQVFSIKTAKGDKYQFELVKPANEFWVRSDGKRTMTYVLPYDQYSVEDTAGGIGEFASSPLAGQLGNGFGPLLLSLLDPETTDVVIEDITGAEYLGEEQEGEQTLHHARYVAGGMTWDAWFLTGDSPRLVRVKPDLEEVSKKAPQAKQFDNFSFQMKFEIKNYDPKPGLPADAFAMKAPEGAWEVEYALMAPTPPNELLGKKAPLFDALDTAGQPIDLGALVGKKVIIFDFWATWCGPCVQAMPIIDKVADEYAAKGVVLYAVNQGEEAAAVTNFLASKEFDVNVAMDVDGQAGARYAIEGLPTTVIIGLDGRVQVVHVGLAPSLEETLREDLDLLLAGKNLAAEKIDEWSKRFPDQPVGGKRAAAAAE
ncbi:Thiol-disulfide oxidoreductase ResA [Posidoniimonas corsicana]|uniref:Thiol-disulfide oxidoreductase ResA n=1 Tax=Posidoniimonas corsicana TaxID=1938618 RepID=A0A5C5VKC6_9BACT|nr:redoxin family protein [Posidoniimonas corsicana]TWT38275.1 Thiol-disulfide oxidoreductase ResA [Posidoniimonas corsicana]